MSHILFQNRFQVVDACLEACHRIRWIVVFDKWNVEPGELGVVEYLLEINDALPNGLQGLELGVEIFHMPDGEASRILLEQVNRVDTSLGYPGKVQFHLNVRRKFRKEFIVRHYTLN